MKTSITMYDRTISCEVTRDDLTTDEMLEIFIGLLVAHGYHIDSIKSSLTELAKEYYED